MHLSVCTRQQLFFRAIPRILHFMYSFQAIFFANILVRKKSFALLRIAQLKKIGELLKGDLGQFYMRGRCLSHFCKIDELFSFSGGKSCFFKQKAIFVTQFSHRWMDFPLIGYAVIVAFIKGCQFWREVYRILCQKSRRKSRLVANKQLYHDSTVHLTYKISWEKKGEKSCWS